MKDDYSLIVLVLITVGLSLLLWKYQQNGGGSEDGQFQFADPYVFDPKDWAPNILKPDDPGFQPNPYLSPADFNKAYTAGIAAQNAAKQYATATTNYQKMLQNLPTTGANIQKIDAAKKATDAAYSKAQSARKDFYGRRALLNDANKKMLAKRLSKP